MQYALAVEHDLTPRLRPVGAFVMDRPRWAENLKRYREAAGMTRQALARRVGITTGMITRYEQGRVGKPGAQTAAAIARELHITYEELLGLEAPPPPPPPPAPLYPRDARILRFLGRAGADPRAGEERLEANASADRYVLEAIGDCLEPDIVEGDYLGLSIDRRPVIGDVVAVVVHGELHLKRVMHDPGGQLVLWSRRGELTTGDEGVEVLGTIITITRPVPRTRFDLGNPGRPRAGSPELSPAP